MSGEPLNKIIPDAEALVSLQPPELGGLILEHLCSLPLSERQAFHLRNYTGWYTGNSHSSPYPESAWEGIVIAISEAWAWLQAHGFIAPRADGGSDGWVFVTRLGKQAKTAGGVREFRKALDLPKDRLHPAIAERCYSHFMRGLFDTAVFEAYKALEISIREASSYGPEMYGPPMARKAFGDNGPLRSLTGIAAEENGLADLMAGALGSYKNPHSHRNVSLSPDEAVEMIILASHLLRIVEARRR